LTFKSETEKLVYTICGIWEKVKKPGLADEALGKLGDLTLERSYHNCSRGIFKEGYTTAAGKTFYINSIEKYPL